MRQPDFRALHLTLAGAAAQLLDRLDHGEDAVHAGMHARQAAAVGIHGQRSAGTDGSARDQCAGLPFPTEVQIFQKQHDVDGEGVVQLQDVDSSGFTPAMAKARGPETAAGGHREVGASG